MPASVIPFDRLGDHVTERTANSNIYPASGIYLKKGISCDTNIDMGYNTDGYPRIQLSFQNAAKTNLYTRSFTLPDRHEQVMCEVGEGNELVLICDGKKRNIMELIPGMSEISNWIMYPYRVEEAQGLIQDQIYKICDHPKKMVVAAE